MVDMNSLSNKVIVLNADYQFMNIVSFERAFLYLAKNKVVIEKYREKVMTTTEESFKIPLVVRFIYLVKQILNRRVPWSKKNICIRDNYICAYCGVHDPHHMTVDHVVPKSLGGNNTFENCVASCKKCNNLKGDRSCQEMNMFPKHRMVHPTISEFMKQWYKQFDVDDIIKTLWD